MTGLATILRRLGSRRGFAERATVAPAPEIWAFDARSNALGFNLMATVLPPIAAPFERQSPVIYLEIQEDWRLDHLFLDPEQARLMLARLEFALAAASLSFNTLSIDGLRFTRCECRAMQRVLTLALVQVAELGA